MSRMIPFRSSWLIQTDHIPNPYLQALPRIEPPIEPKIQPPIFHPVQGSEPWVWSDTGFTRPLTTDEQYIFTHFIAPCFQPLIDSNHPVADRNRLAFLLCTNPGFQQAFATAAAHATSYPRLPRESWEDVSSYQPYPICIEEIWLSVWPWIPTVVRRTLYAHFWKKWSYGAQVALTMLDPDAPLPVTPDRIVPFNDDLISPHLQRMLSRPQTPDTILDYFRTHPPRPDGSFHPIETVLMQFLGPDELTECFEITGCHTEHALECPLASPALVAEALSQHRDVYTDSHVYNRMIVLRPYLAQILPIEQLLTYYPDRVLHCLVPWIFTRQIDAPRLDIVRSVAFQVYLLDEWDGPYADLAELLWPMGFTEDPPRRDYVSGIGPVSHTEAQRLLNDPTTPEAGLALCIRSGCPKMGPALAKHPNLTAELAHRMSTHWDRSIRVAIIGHPLLNPADLEKLSFNPTKDEEAALIIHDTLTPEKIDTYLYDRSPTIRGGLAQHRALPYEIMTILLRDRSSVVRAKLAQSIMLPTELLTVLAKDPSPAVRRNVVEHPLCPVELLRLLGHDKSRDVRCALAQNLRTPKEIIDRLARRPFRALAEILVHHPALSDTDRIRLTLTINNRH